MGKPDLISGRKKWCFQHTQDGGDGGVDSRCVFVSVFAFVFVFAWHSPRLVTLVVRVVQVVEVHLELKTEGNIVPSESE